MPNTEIVFVPTTIPAGTCFANEQERYNFFASHLQGYFPGQFQFWNVGSDEPSVENRDKPWLRLNPDGSLDRPYVFFNGIWCAPYRVPVDSAERMIWTGSTADLQLYDGGNSNAVSDADGPFWEVDTTFEFRMPIGVGTSPAPYSTAIAVGDTGGEEKVSLTKSEMPPHFHDFSEGDRAWISASSGNTVDLFGQPLGTGGQPSRLRSLVSEGGTGTPPVVVAHQNMPPYQAVYFCKRTARIYWTP